VGGASGCLPRAQAGAQTLTPASNRDLDHRARGSHHLRDLLRPIARAKQSEYLACVGRQACEYLRPLNVQIDTIATGTGACLVQRHQRDALAAAQLVPGDVPRDAIQPADAIEIVPPRAPAAQRLQEGVLAEILGHTSVVDKCSKIATQRGSVLLIE